MNQNTFETIHFLQIVCFQTLSSIGTSNMSKETMLRQRLFLTVQKALPGDSSNRTILVIFFPFLISAFFGEKKIIEELSKQCLEIIAG